MRPPYPGFEHPFVEKYGTPNICETEDTVRAHEMSSKVAWFSQTIGLIPQVQNVRFKELSDEFLAIDILLRALPHSKPSGHVIIERFNES